MSGTHTVVTSGPLTVTLNADFGLTVEFGGHGTASVLPPAVFIHGHKYTVMTTSIQALGKDRQAQDSSSAAYTLQCRPAANTSVATRAAGATGEGGRGYDGGFGAPSSSIAINCTANGTAVNFAVLGFPGPAGSGEHDGLVVFEVSMPNGGTGLQMRTPTPGGDSNPPQFAPYPAFDLTASAALDDAVSMCYGAERPHMLVGNGVRAMPEQCMSLAGGMAGLAWPDDQSPSGLAGAITTAANEFHLSLHRIGEAADRGGTTVKEAWTHGLSGEINDVPPGFAGQVML